MNTGLTAASGLTVAIGGLPIHLKSGDGQYLASLERRFAGFTDRTSRALMEFDVVLAEPGRVDPDDELRVTKRDGRWSIERSDCCATFEFESRRGVIKQPPAPYATDSILRVLHTLMLAPRGGLLMHAASAIRNGGAHVFFGPSGAGKSTMVGMAPADVQLLSDEVSYIRRDTGCFAGCGTPFTGELDRVGANIEAPLAGLYRLVQGASHHLEPMPPADAARTVLESVLCFAADPAVVEQIFETVCRLVNDVPVRTLVFRRDPSAWDLIP
jgi:hypothetical protein